MCALTAAYRELPGSASRTTGSSQGVGGVCSVVTTGTSNVSAIAIGRWCRLLLCTTSMSRRRASPSISCR